MHDTWRYLASSPAFLEDALEQAEGYRRVFGLQSRETDDLGKHGALTMLTDAQGRVAHVNGAFERIMGMPIECIRGHKAHEVLHLGSAYEREAITAWLRELRRCGESTPRAVNHLLEGQPAVCLWRAKPIYGSSGQIEYILATGVMLLLHAEKKRSLQPAQAPLPSGR